MGGWSLINSTYVYRYIVSVVCVCSALENITAATEAAEADDDEERDHTRTEDKLAPEMGTNDVGSFGSNSSSTTDAQTLGSVCGWKASRGQSLLLLLLLFGRGQ